MLKADTTLQILIIGTGYVGLVTGTCLAEMGHHVTCLDIDQTKIERLEQGKTPIYEPGLTEMMKRNTQAKRLDFTTSYSQALKKANIAFLCLPTPAKQDDGHPDLSALEKALESIATSLQSDLLLINKSTVPVGTTEAMQKNLQKKLKQLGKRQSIECVSNPEFLKEGTAIHDCMKPDRIVIGTENQAAIAIMCRLYAPFNINHSRILFMDIASAEMTKYAANAMLAARISFMNELSGLCELVGADINKIRIGIGSDRRIGYDFLYAGVGYGGSCFPKDLKGLIALTKDLEYPAPLLNAIETVNQRQKGVLTTKMNHYFKQAGGLFGKTIAIWGIAFKPDTDDIREAPALDLAQYLLSSGATIKVYDPIAMKNVKKYFGKHKNIIYCNSEYEAASQADAIALMTDWKQFRTVNLKKVQDLMRGRAIFDGRNQYDPATIEKNGFIYHGIGIRKT